MKKIFIISLLIVYLSILLSGCSLNTSQEHYYVLVVEGKESLMEEFGEFSSVKNPVIEIDYFKSAKIAKEQFPDYKIAEPPMVFIFSVNQEKIKKILLRTKDVDESLTLLRLIKKEK